MADATSAPIDQFIARRTRVYRIVLAGYAVLLFIGTHLPRSLLPEGGEQRPDLIVHLVSYGILATLLWRALPAQWSELRRAAYTWLIAAGFGAFDEITQAIPGLNRTPDWSDYLFNMLGVTLAIAGAWMTLGRRHDATLRGKVPMRDLMK